MFSLLCVGAGGFIGAVARYLMVEYLPYGGDFPLATMLVNFLGAVVIGAVMEAVAAWPGFPANAVLFLKTGVCGGFTTFSSFSLETVNLIDRGRYAMAGAYAGGSVIACLAGVGLGQVLMHAAMSALRGAEA